MAQEEGRAEQPSADAAGMVMVQVQIRAEHAHRLQALAAREGATPEALAALMLEEKLDEAKPS